MIFIQPIIEVQNELIIIILDSISLSQKPETRRQVYNKFSISAYSAGISFGIGRLSLLCRRASNAAPLR